LNLVQTSSNWFRKSRVQLNLELNLRFSSAGALNLELNFGLVWPGSGSNLGSEPNCGNTIINAGGAEVLRDQISTLKERMESLGRGNPLPK
jgi:hypothetical protein